MRHRLSAPLEGAPSWGAPGAQLDGGRTASHNRQQASIRTHPVLIDNRPRLAPPAEGTRRAHIAARRRRAAPRRLHSAHPDGQHGDHPQHHHMIYATQSQRLAQHRQNNTNFRSNSLEKDSDSGRSEGFTVLISEFSVIQTMPTYLDPSIVRTVTEAGTACNPQHVVKTTLISGVFRAKKQATRGGQRGALY